MTLEEITIAIIQTGIQKPEELNQVLMPVAKQYPQIANAAVEEYVKRSKVHAIAASESEENSLHHIGVSEYYQRHAKQLAEAAGIDIADVELALQDWQPRRRGVFA